MHVMPAVPVLATPQRRTPSYWYEKGLPRSDLKTNQDIKTQDISYFKVDGKVSVGMKRKVPIDWPRARSEITVLGCGGHNHFIGFENNRTLEMIQFARYDADDWYADVPIDSRRRDWQGFVWGCRADTESVLNTAGLFFEELPWFDSLQFTMRRVSNWKKYAGGGAPA